ncbi:MAG: FtsQ-type POTRA domain-containing protein [Nitrospinae bacterium]|nr:FtsQ-type POTRA domain-containing protein [Nitrospinota bacterium]
MPVEANKTIITQIPEREKEGAGSAFATAFKAACATAAVILSLLAVYAGYEVVARNQIFTVSEVRITGAAVLKENDILKIIGPVDGKGLLGLDIKEIGARLASEPWVESVEIRRELPGSLAVSIKERTPLFRASISGAAWLVDGAGVLVAKMTGVDDTPLPALRGAALVGGEARPGGSLDERSVKDAHAALTGLAGYRLLGKWPVAGLDVSQPGIVKVMFKNSDTSLTVPRGKWSDVAERLFTVDHILRTKGGAEPVSINVAFPGRVVVAYPGKGTPQEGRKAGNG